MDMHIHVLHLTIWESAIIIFFEQIEGLIMEVNAATPAEVAGELMKSRDVESLPSRACQVSPFRDD